MARQSEIIRMRVSIIDNRKECRSLKTRLFSGLVMILLVMTSVSGTLAKGSESVGVGNPVAALYDTENVAMVGQIGGVVSAVNVQAFRGLPR